MVLNKWILCVILLCIFTISICSAVPGISDGGVVIGTKWYNGAGAPAVSTGSAGDFYLNSATGDIYFKTPGAWVFKMNIYGGTDTSAFVMLDGSRLMTGTLQMDMHNITGLSLPIGNTEAANKYYVDNAIASMTGMANMTANMTAGTPGTNGVNNMTPNMTAGSNGADGVNNMTPNMTANMTSGVPGATGTTGGDGGQILYFDHVVSPDLTPYEMLKFIPAGNTETDETITVKSGLGQVLIDSYVTDIGYPALTAIPAGLWRFRTFHHVSGASGTTNILFKLYNRTATGTETLLFTATSDDINALTVDEYLTSYVTITPYTVSSTDRLVCKVYGTATHPSGITLHFVYDGSTHTSHILSPLDISPATTLTFSAIAGATLKKGQAVYISGATGSDPLISLANNTETTKSRVVGLVTTDIATGVKGQVRRSGILTDVDTRNTNLNINPSAETWIAGDLLFTTTDGGLTKTRPTSGRSVKAAYTLLGSNANDVLLAYPMENPVWVTSAQNEDIVLRMGDNAGVNKISIRNYSNYEVGYIYSNGTSSFGTNINSVGQMNQTPNMTANMTAGTPGTNGVNNMTANMTAGPGRITSSSTLIYSDFYSVGTTSMVPGLLGATDGGLSTATLNSTISANHPGVVNLRDTADVNVGFRIGCGASGVQLIGGGETFEAIFQPSGVRVTQTVQMGWSDAANSRTLPVDGIWFNMTADGAAFNIRGNTSSNSVRSGTLTSYTPTVDTWYRGTITVDEAATLVTYTIYNESGVSQWTDTVATNIPTGEGRTTTPCLQEAEATTDAGADILRMDYVRWGTTRTLVR